MPEILSLVKVNCKDCHKCIRFCPVKAIKFSGERANIISSQCILCGQCYNVCPHGAKEIVDESSRVAAMVKSGAPVIACVDPSFVAAYQGSTIKAVRRALLDFGFSQVRETTSGAELVRRDYERIANESGQDVVITSSCPVVVNLIEKHYPEMRRFLTNTVSPMIAEARLVKRETPEAKVVFIGPCIARKAEAAGTEVDAVLTFAQMNDMLKKEGIFVERDGAPAPGPKTRLFSVSGGIIKSMDFKDADMVPISLDGIHVCMSALDDIERGTLGKCFIEMSACRLGCIGGPVIRKFRNNPTRNSISILRSAGEELPEVEPLDDEAIRRTYLDRHVPQKMPSAAELDRIMRSMGKRSAADELNCGSCGYDTCRDKAIAVYRGIADPNICLPFVMEKSKNISNSIIDNSPNGLILLNEDFEIQQINKRALTLLNISHQSDVLGENVIRILDPTPFFKLYESKDKLTRSKGYYSDYDRYMEQTIVHDFTTHTFVCMLRDVTDEELERQKKEALERKTVDIADRVVEKQMRVVQEIAMLLGETTAETKIALTKLKESIELDDK